MSSLQSMPVLGSQEASSQSLVSKFVLGEQVVISIIVNGVAEPGVRTALIDDIVVQLANFNGQID